MNEDKLSGFSPTGRNPTYLAVKRDLVPEPGDYRWSSYNWHMGENDVPLMMDEHEL